MANPPAIETKTLDTWSAVVSAADQVDVGERVGQPAFVFRGQEDFGWTLKPSLHRAATNDGMRGLPDAAALLQLETTVTERFRGLATTQLPIASVWNRNALIDWWPLMRHYGVPTRLIDWTASFYVAAYFAVSKAPDKDGAIYSLHAHTLDQVMQRRHGNDGQFVTDPGKIDKAYTRPDAPSAIFLFGRRSALLDREVSQQGLFMVGLNVAADLEEVIAREMPQNIPNLVAIKFRIPANQKPIIMRKLQAMNVQASALFPGLDGIGRRLDELIRNRD